MNLEELQSVQSGERSNSSLQNLRETFYEDVGEYIQELKAERSRIADQVDDPFGSPEVRRLTDEIESAEEVAEAIYERRMGKLVKQASLAAAGMNADTEGLTLEERELFDALVERIEDNKSRVLDVLAGEAPAPPTGGVTDAVEDTAEAASDAPPAPPEPPAPEGESVDAADLMGSDPDAPESTAASTPDSTGEAERAAGEPDAESAATDGSPTEADAVDAEPAEAIAAAERERAREAGDPAVDESGSSSDDEEELVADGARPASPGDGGPVEDRTAVLIKQDLGDIYGVDDREYTLSSDDVVSLPTQNAEPLVERGAAERLD